MTPAPPSFADPAAVADAIIARVGKRIVVGMPLGLGKANHIINALYDRAAADPTISLHLFGALTLQKPRYKTDLERRFLSPVIERLFGGYPDLAYVAPMKAGALPPNIRVNEFFFQAGVELSDAYAQQHYISANYTHALRYLLDAGVNVVTQLVAKRETPDGSRYSLSCNTDITVDLLKARAQGRADFVLAGQVNDELPFMPGEGDLGPEAFQVLLDSPATQFPLFAPPNEPVGPEHYATAFHVAGLVPDGGTLQFGIGSTSDAVVQALVLREKNPAVFADTLTRLQNGAAPTERHDQPFKKGLYAASEMFVDGFLTLMREGVLKREVDGAVLHGGFFLGPKSFYKALRDLPEAMRVKLQMVAVSFTNELYGDEASKIAARTGARFINNAMMATLTGAVVSDGLADGGVVSGVGGQYNFVAQAFALPDARSVITLNATRGVGRKTASNIVWNYGHTTIPRHLRDVIVTEYGVADLRGKSDMDVIAAMLNVADSRFQPALMKQAKAARKLPADYAIPAAHRDNTPERIERALKPAGDAGALPLFPLGTDFDAVELRLLPLLAELQKAALPAKAASLAFTGLLAGKSVAAEALHRLDLERPASLQDRLFAILIKGAAVRSAAPPPAAKR